MELAELQPKVAQRQKQKERSADWHRARKAVADRVAVLEELAEQGPLTVEQAVELAKLQPKVAQQKQKQKERDADRYQGRKAAAAQVAVLEELAEQWAADGGAGGGVGGAPAEGAAVAETEGKVGGLAPREGLLSIVLRCWRSWRSSGR
ncbi:hypothetical protein [Saccharopolyspora spinosa]|uniref:hypothetical protein n=1 Tax=Saccharopolyspora spinosa TaxID=60894 RepID=UPI00376EDF25